MPNIQSFIMHKQQGGLSCWVAAARSVLDLFGSADGVQQKELVSLYSSGQETGDPEKILRAAGALRNSTQQFRGDDAALRQAPIVFLRIKDSIDRNEPVIVNLRPAGGRSTGHALIIFGYEILNQVVKLKDPARPDKDISVPLNDLILSFAPYSDRVELASLRYYAEKFIFTQKPPMWRSRRVALPKQYSKYY
jgi:hypothetical protein